MRMLRGNEDLQLAKDLLKGFENKHYPNSQVCSDIDEGLYWDDGIQCYSADLGFILRGETDEVRIFEVEDEWIGVHGSRFIAWMWYGGKMYFFAVRF